MAALVCDICGGKLVGKPGGMFECEYCGVQYDTAWAKEKIQEIKGTVKVEGTVDVKGTVKIDGPVRVEGSVNIESLLKRGEMALADKEWEDAEKFFDEALNIDAERGEIHFGLLCARYRQPDVDSLLKNKYAQIRANKAFQRALAFADEKTKQQTAALEKQFEKERSAQQEQSVTQVQELEPLRAQIRPAQDLVCCTEKLVVAAKTDGTLLTLTDKYLDKFEAEWYENLCNRLSKWENIIALSASHHHVVGLKADGTVVTASKYGKDGEGLDVSKWRDIAAIAAGRDRTIGLKKDGRVVVTGKRYEPDPLTKEIQFDLSGWKNIAGINCYSDADVGIRNDGTVVIGGHVRRSAEAEVERIGEWKNIVSIAPCTTGWGAEDFIGLCNDGSLQHRRGNTGGLGITRIYAGRNAVFALDKDGNVLKVRWDGKTENYLLGENIVAIAPQELDLICLKADGTLIRRTSGDVRRDFEGWKLFENVETIEQERIQYAEQNAHRIEKERAAAYEKACHQLEKKMSPECLKEALAIFKKLKNYRDAAQKLPECEAALACLREQEKNDEAYKKACSTMQKIDISHLRMALEVFDKLGDWHDSTDLAARCREQIEALKQIDRLCAGKMKLEKERAELGLFAMKRKKEIAEQVQSIEMEIDRIKKEELK